MIYMQISDFFPIWNELTEKERRDISDNSREAHFKKGELVHTADDCVGVILIKSGQLRAYTVSEDGREITMYRLFERDICLFSASCIMRSIRFEITISAEKETCAIIIPTDLYRSVMDRSAPLANYTTEVVSARFTDVMWLIEQVMWKSFDRRLAEFLINESSIEGADVLKITHEEIGNHLGSPREVVTRMLKYFSEDGIIALKRGSVEILDRRALIKISEK